MPTKLYKNTGKDNLNVVGVGEMKPGDQISLSGQYLPVVIMENYPGLVDITDAQTVPSDQKQTDQKPTVNTIGGEGVVNNG